jgi:bifunctional UDP-N-acetylglucosamine pyrophosphorylase/glucosamine-1-phosphate N-acetyltransferase
MAAGQGTRMKSTLPKVLHEAAGRPLLYYPVRAALDAGATEIVVVVNPKAHDAIGDALHRHLPEVPIALAVQEVPRGTGDAARAGIAKVTTERVLLLSGDTPLLTCRELTPLLEEGAELRFLSCLLDDPTGYGRVLRSPAGQVLGIREHRDLESDAQRAIREINAGVYAGRTDTLRRALEQLTPNNAQGEYYLTDVVELLAQSGSAVEAVICPPSALVGVNDRAQLQAAEEVLFTRIARGWGERGVTVRGRVLIDDTVKLDVDVLLEDGVRLRGATQVGRGAFIDVGSVLTDVSVGPETVVKPYSVLSQSSVGQRAQIGPFSHLRPDSTIEDEAHIGNFVETKKTRVRRGAKANHLAYLGDGDVGENANIGAGTIFCNYDGYRKHQTTIGAGAFIGSDSQLIAPVRIGAGAYVATGTSVTEDVPDDGFAIGRCRQTTKPDYAPRLKTRLKP